MIDSGDTAWVLTSSALVFIMVPGLAFFYAGLVRGKNALSTLLQSFIALAIVGLTWILFGYSLSFGPDVGGFGFIGNLEWAGLHGVSATEAGPYAETIPHQAFMVFQAKFAIITPALIAGAFAERIKFSTFVIFVVAWSTIVYTPLAHWMWGTGGWLGGAGALDFAGGSVVHISSGAAALAAAIIFGRRLGFGQMEMAPHNVPFVVLGASLLWFGWFGFNAGSDLASVGRATSAFVVTHISASTAAVVWVSLDWIINRRPSVVGAATGAVAGLGYHHSGLRLRGAHARGGYRAGRRCSLLHRRLAQDPRATRRLSRRLGYSRGGRNLGHAGYRPLHWRRVHDFE